MAYLLESGIAIALNNTPTTATRASGGASGATSVVISAANPDIAYNQKITGTGFAANTTVTSVSGTTINFTPASTGQISGTITFSTNWHKLTDHNRGEINISTELIESSSRMANGSMRKYVVAQKNIISTSWEFVPSKTSETVDLNYSAAWIESFYRANSGVPIYLKLVSSEIDPDTAFGAIPNESGNNFKTAAESTLVPDRPNATGSRIYPVFMTSFDKTIIKRTKVSDYVDMSIEFTEI
jgi:hypothetical protein